MNLSGQDKRFERLEALVDSKADTAKADSILRALGAQIGQLGERVSKLEAEKKP